MCDDIVHNPRRPGLDGGADADMAVRWAAVGAAPQAGFHRRHPADGFPADFVLKAGLIKLYRARLQIRVGAAFRTPPRLRELVLDGAQQGGDACFRQPCGYAYQHTSIRCQGPAGALFEALVAANGDRKGGAVFLEQGVFHVGHDG